MPTIDSNDWTDIAATRTDADSPVDETLMNDIRENINFLKLWLGKDYLSTAVANHNHDGSNSAPVPGASGGKNIAVVNHLGFGTAQGNHQPLRCFFKPEYMFLLVNADSNVAANDSVVRSLSMANGAGLISTAYTTGLGVSQFHFGGFNISAVDAVGNGADSDNVSLLLQGDGTFTKTGSYTGNGATQTITCGFQPEFVIVNRVDTGVMAVKSFSFSATGSKVYKAAEMGVHKTDLITGFTSTGFTLGANADGNQNTIAFNFLAIKPATVSGETVARKTWTGNASNPRVFTDVGFCPQFVIVLDTTTTTSALIGVVASSPHSFINGSHSLGTATRSTVNVTDYSNTGFTVNSGLNASGVVYDAFCFSGGTRYSAI